MNIIMGIVVLALMVVLWVLYHKIFRVVYFGNLGNHILGEFLTCLFVSIFLISIIGALMGNILGLIGVVILFLLKWIIILGGIIGAIILAKKIFSLIAKKSHRNASESTLDAKIDEEDASIRSAMITSVVDNNKNTEKEKVSSPSESVDSSNDKKNNTMFCVHCGKKILRTAKFCNFCGSENTYKE